MYFSVAMSVNGLRVINDGFLALQLIFDSFYVY